VLGFQPFRFAHSVTNTVDAGSEASRRSAQLPAITIDVSGSTTLPGYMAAADFLFQSGQRRFDNAKAPI
jgi:hypothetical protein